MGLNMSYSKIGEDQTERFEGVRLTSYQDSGGNGQSDMGTR